MTVTASKRAHEESAVSGETSDAPEIVTRLRLPLNRRKPEPTKINSPSEYEPLNRVVPAPENERRSPKTAPETQT
ncbi:MAG: hypothetical protein IJE77_03030, partial [Thermoguttaceae bacterium]|nr:hypothetical protein [Thermoguttaceae bacterium]